MKKQLFDASDGSDEEIELKTNKEYAKYYKQSRKRELLQKFKDRGLDISESDSDSDSDSSDEAEVNDAQFDEEFFKTLASLKSKDPVIYNKETRFFASENVDDVFTKKLKKQKPVTIKDYERKILLENNGEFSSADEEAEEKEQFNRTTSPTLVEEEKQLKAEFKKIVHSDESDENDEEENAFGGIFKKRQKSQKEQEEEEADFTSWLSGKVAHLKSEVEEKLVPLKQYWQNNDLPRGEQFLRDYILNKGYVNTKLNDIPTYEEIVNDENDNDIEVHTKILLEDEKELEKQAEFEYKYNFRFEEPDKEFIKRYPRTIENSLRLTDDKRREKRKQIKERKLTEKEQKMKELEMVKKLKRQEIEEKLQKLRQITGNDELGFKDEELEEDFDPNAHDKRMAEIFNDDYYAVDEGEEKPECPSDIEELKIEDWDAYDPNAENEDENQGPHCEDDDFNMDLDYDPNAAKEKFQQELIENTKGRKGRKARRRNRFIEMLKTEKPNFDPAADKTYEEYLDEYYKLDCEDFIDDLPCRFKYVETTPNDFGLTIEEILLAKNKELNRWASLKKATQIRPEAVEKKEARLYKLKAKNEDLKRKIFKSLYGENSDDEDNNDKDDEPVNETIDSQNSSNVVAAQENKKKKKKKKRKTPSSTETVKDETPATKKTKLESNETISNKSPVANNQFKQQPQTKVNKQNPFKVKTFGKQQQTNTTETENPISDARMKAYGINPKKYHKKQKYMKK